MSGGGGTMGGGGGAASGGGEPVSGAGAPLLGEALLGAIVGYAEDKKAIDVVELDLRGVLGYTDYFLVCSGNTGRQAKAIHDGILEGLKREHKTLPRRVEGSAQAGWILMDYLDVVVHVFTPDTREFYRLEQLWGEVPARAAGERVT
jgi:ribosome-associated protein